MIAPTLSLLAAEQLTRTSTGEAVQFWLLASLAVIGALGMVAAPKAVHSAIFLAMTMVMLAVFYIAQGALFLGVVQIVVYTGAVMMLFLFVLMLIGVDSSDSLVETLRGQRVAAVVAGIGVGALLIGGIGNAAVGGVDWNRAHPRAGAASGSTINGLADLIFVRYLWAFELTGALLITATIGAMVLAHRERLTPKAGQPELSRRRFRDGARVTPLPSPGVYARHNAADMPARLPDGSPALTSVSGILRPRALPANGNGNGNGHGKPQATAAGRPPHPESEAPPEEGTR